MAQSYPGFYFGRFDVRSPSIEDLQAGSFEVLELNGVSAEATHIYDASVSLRKAYRTLLVQWRIAFEIGLMNRTTGSGPMPLKEFLCLVYGATRRGRALRTETNGARDVLLRTRRVDATSLRDRP
jgi:hypothetical protein